MRELIAASSEHEWPRFRRRRDRARHQLRHITGYTIIGQSILEPGDEGLLLRSSVAPAAGNIIAARGCRSVPAARIRAAGARYRRKVEGRDPTAADAHPLPATRRATRPAASDAGVPSNGSAAIGGKQPSGLILGEPTKTWCSRAAMSVGPPCRACTRRRSALYTVPQGRTRCRPAPGYIRDPERAIRERAKKALISTPRASRRLVPYAHRALEGPKD